MELLLNKAPTLQGCVSTRTGRNTARQRRDMVIHYNIIYINPLSRHRSTAAEKYKCKSTWMHRLGPAGRWPGPYQRLEGKTVRNQIYYSMFLSQTFILFSDSRKKMFSLPWKNLFNWYITLAICVVVNPLLLKIVSYLHFVLEHLGIFPFIFVELWGKLISRCFWDGRDDLVPYDIRLERMTFFFSILGWSQYVTSLYTFMIVMSSKPTENSFDVHES